MLQLTWHSVDCFKRPQYPHCSDGCQVDVLQVQWVFNHPEENKMHRTNSLTKTSICVHDPHELQFTHVLHFFIKSKMEFSGLSLIQTAQELFGTLIFVLALSFELLLWLHLEVLGQYTPAPLVFAEAQTQSVSNCVDTNVNEWVRVCEPI